MILDILCSDILVSLSLLIVIIIIIYEYASN